MPRSRSWMPYEVTAKIRRDVIIGIGLLIVAVAGLLLANLGDDGLDWNLVSGQTYELSDGTPCQLMRLAPIDAKFGDGVTMLDCGDREAPTFLVRRVLMAIGAIGAYLLMAGFLARMLASRMPSETIGLPIFLVGVIAGVALLLWGGAAPGRHLVYQLDDGSALSGVLSADNFTLHMGAGSAGLALLGASLARMLRS